MKHWISADALDMDLVPGCPACKAAAADGSSPRMAHACAVFCAGASPVLLGEAEYAQQHRDRTFLGRAAPLSWRQRFSFPHGTALCGIRAAENTIVCTTSFASFFKVCGALLRGNITDSQSHMCFGPHYAWTYSLRNYCHQAARLLLRSPFSQSSLPSVAPTRFCNWLSLSAAPHFSHLRSCRDMLAIWAALPSACTCVFLDWRPRVLILNPWLTRTQPAPDPS